MNKESRKFELTLKSENTLVEIAKDSSLTWGKKQSKDYINQLSGV